MKKRLTSIFLALTALMTFVSCSTSSSKASDNGDYLYSYTETTSASFGSAKSKVEYDDGEVLVEDVYEAPASAESGNIQNDLSERKIIKTANLSFQTQEYDSFMEDMSSCIALYGGYIESSEARDGGVYSTRFSRSSNHTVRIPQSSYNDFMNEVCTLGSMTYKSENSEDVTMSYVDTESRITAYETEYNALIEILDKAESLDDVLQLQSRISEVTYLLESYKSQLRKYDSLISYCTINIDVEEVWRETKSEDVMTFSEKISTGLEDTFLDIKEDVTEFTVDLITSLPYIIIWAIVIIVVVIIVKANWKKIKKQRDAKKENEKDQDKEIK